MHRAAFILLAVGLALAAAPAAAQQRYLVAAPPRTDFERCIVEAWTQAAAPVDIHRMHFRGQVSSMTLAGETGDLVVATEFLGQTGEVVFRARTAVTGVDAVTEISGQERMRSNLFGRPMQMRANPVGLDQDIDVPIERSEYLGAAARHVVNLYQPAARACRAAAAASSPE